MLQGWPSEFYKRALYCIPLDIWFILIGRVNLLYKHLAMLLYGIGIVAWLYLQIKWHGLMCVSYIHNAIMKALPYINSNPSHSSVALTALLHPFPLEMLQQLVCWSQRDEHLRYTWKHGLGSTHGENREITVGRGERPSQSYWLVDKKFPGFRWDFGEGL